MTPADPTPVPPHLSDAERALWEKASATSAMTGWWFPSNALERDGFLPENAEFVAACSPAVIHSLLTALSSEREAGERDKARLDSIERWAIAYHGPEANGEDCVQLTGPCHEDADECDDDCTNETRAYRWEVTGPPCADGFGNSIGSGVSLRAAIDDALLEETNPAARKVTQ